jgi:hypothetical protein
MSGSVVSKTRPCPNLSTPTEPLEHGSMPWGWARAFEYLDDVLGVSNHRFVLDAR